MAKSLLYRLFGFGKVPKRLLPELRREGIALIEEGIGGTVFFRNLKAPGRRHSWKRTCFVGALVMTEKRLAAYTFNQTLIDVTFQSGGLRKLRCSLKGEGTLVIVFDAQDFDGNQSGEIECRFHTPKARIFLEQIIERTEG